MSSKTSATWVGGLAFDADINGHHLIMDADRGSGGDNRGPRPKPLLLAALSGCSGMDVVSILEKMRVGGFTLRIDTEADSTSEHPFTYHTIRFSFHFEGSDLPPEKLVKAVTLSTQKYCGVYAMLQKSARIIVKIFINNQEVEQ